MVTLCVKCKATMSTVYVESTVEFHLFYTVTVLLIRQQASVSLVFKQMNVSFVLTKCVFIFNA